jgi:hypothetical protein
MYAARSPLLGRATDDIGQATTTKSHGRCRAPTHVSTVLATETASVRPSTAESNTSGYRSTAMKNGPQRGFHALCDPVVGRGRCHLNSPPVTDNRRSNSYLNVHDLK